LAVNSNDTPPARDRGDRAQSDTSPVAPGQTAAASSLPPANVSAAAGRLPISSEPPAPDRPDPASTRHRVASGLPPQPPPPGLTTGAVRPDQPSAFSAKGGLGLHPPGSGPATGAGAATSDLPMADSQRSGKMLPVSAAPSPSTPNPVTPQPAAPARVVLGEPEPPISGRPD